MTALRRHVHTCAGEGCAGEGEAWRGAVCEAWRRAAAETLVRLEFNALRRHLFPHVQVSSGVEVLPHLARAWRETHSDERAYFDQSNARNAVDRTPFLMRVHTVIPGMVRWLRSTSPLDSLACMCFTMAWSSRHGLADNRDAH